MIIANYTPDPIHWMHGGVDGILKPGDIAEMPDNRAKHVLNKFDRRGILQLNFGDVTEQKREEAMKIWKRFWERQITIFNQDNERRKNTNREYVDPTEELRAHAETLGVKLVGPWSISVTDDSKMRSVLEENVALRSQIDMLAAQVKALAEAVKSREIPMELRTAAEKIELSKRGAESPVTEAEQRASSQATQKLIAEFQMLNREKFGEWVMTNLDRIQSSEFPPAIRTMIREKWERLVQGEFPVPA